MNYYERHLGDYARDAAHLSMLEHGAYTLLLDRCYTTERGIPADQAHRVCRAKTRDERTAVDSVLAEFFTLEDGVWMNGRVIREITKMQAKVKAAQENGRRGGRPKQTQVEPTGLLLGSVSVTQIKALQSPDTSNQENKVKTISQPTVAHPPAGGLSASFIEFWTAWPAGERKQDKAKCAKHWKLKHLDDAASAVLADVRSKRGTTKWADGYIESPLVYLHGRRWEDGGSEGAVVEIIDHRRADTERYLAEQHARPVTRPTQAIRDLLKLKSVA